MSHPVLGFQKRLISSNTSSADPKENPSPYPISVAIRQISCQSGSASPGGATAGWKRVRLRSELIITPSDSVHRVAGSATSAYGRVSFSANTSCTTTSSQRCNASMTRDRLDTLAMGLVQMIQQALILPSAIWSNMSMVPVPTSLRRVPRGTSQVSSQKSRSASEITARWPGKPGPM